MNVKTSQNRIISLTFFCVLIFIITFNLVYRLTLCGSDYSSHIIFANNINFKHFFTSPVAIYPVWHFSILLLSKLLSISMNTSAAVVVAIFKVTTYIVIYKSLCYLTDNSISKTFCCAISFMLVIVEPLYVPWFSKYIYLGQWSPNIWHNPTNISVIPLGILIFIIFIKLYNQQLSNQIKNQNIKFCVMSILLLFSNFIKPSFIQVFIPAIIVFSIIEYFINKKKNFSFHFKTAISLLPTCTITLLQIFLVFNTNAAISSGLEFSFLEVWRKYSTNIFFSTLISLAFPIYVLAINYKSIIKNKALFFSTTIIIIGWLEFACLSETGSRKNDANFSWAYMVGMNFIWIVSTSVFLNNQYNKKKLNRKTKCLSIAGYVLLCLHFFSGVLYLKQFFLNNISF